MLFSNPSSLLFLFFFSCPPHICRFFSPIRFFFAGTQVPKVLTEALDNAGMGVEDVDWLLLHQVNK